MEVKIKRPGDTRWNSSHLMFLTLIKNQEVLDRALVGSKLTGLDDAEWITIYFFNKMLGQVAMCLRQLEGEKTVTINYVLLLILQLEKKWKAELNFTPDFGFLNRKFGG